MPRGHYNSKGSIIIGNPRNIHIFTIHHLTVPDDAPGMPIFFRPSVITGTVRSPNPGVAPPVVAFCSWGVLLRLMSPL